MNKQRVYPYIGTYVSLQPLHGFAVLFTEPRQGYVIWREPECFWPMFRMGRNWSEKDFKIIVRSDS